MLGWEFQLAVYIHQIIEHTNPKTCIDTRKDKWKFQHIQKNEIRCKHFLSDTFSYVFKKKNVVKKKGIKTNPTHLENGLLYFFYLLFHILPVLLLNFTHSISPFYFLLNWNKQIFWCRQPMFQSHELNFNSILERNSIKS